MTVRTSGLSIPIPTRLSQRRPRCCHRETRAERLPARPRASRRGTPCARRPPRGWRQGTGLAPRWRVHGGGRRSARAKQRHYRVGAVGRSFSTTSTAMFVRGLDVRIARNLRDQLRDDVVLHAWCRRGSERDDRRRAQQRKALAEHPVSRTKVVSPLRDAVGLVDGDERRRAVREHLGKAGHLQAFGSDEEEVQPSVEVGGQAARDASRSGPTGCDPRRAHGPRASRPDPRSARSAADDGVVPPRASPGS